MASCIISSTESTFFCGIRTLLLIEPCLWDFLWYPFFTSYRTLFMGLFESKHEELKNQDQKFEK